MTDGDVCPPKLAIVIHTEEEFDWDSGFKVDATTVSHGRELFDFVEAFSSLGAKTTLAMDYAFVNSQQGQACIKDLQCTESVEDKVEFATHLHPWVNPPWNNTALKEVTEVQSYPGNLSFEDEFSKLSFLTDKIKETTGVSPVTYLAGRYGIGKNTASILSQLGYKIDVSISPFADFRQQYGTDFSSHNNKITVQNGILNWPHTSAVVSPFKYVRRFFNSSPSAYASNTFGMRVFKKLSRAKLHRLSPEGFSLRDMQSVTKYQYALGQSCFILSFHSPSVKSGLTPYVRTPEELEKFKEKTLTFLSWFKTSLNGEFITVKDHPSVQQYNNV